MCVCIFVVSWYSIILNVTAFYMTEGELIMIPSCPNYNIFVLFVTGENNILPQALFPAAEEIDWENGKTGLCVMLRLQQLESILGVVGKLD